MLAMMVSIVWSGLQANSDNWQHNVSYLIVPALSNTLLLLLGNWCITLPLGVGLAWLVSRFDFYGRYYFERLFIVPIAIPPYVLAFILLDTFAFSGRLNYQLALWGIRLEVEANSVVFVILAISMVTFPYIYLLCRSSFKHLQSSQLERAKLLGLSEWQVFRRLALPTSLPAIVAGAALVGMETLADFGTVSSFNFDTLTTLIYRTWFSLFDIEGAMKLASLLLGLVLISALLYQFFRSKRQRFNVHHNQPNRLVRLPLPGQWQIVAISFCALVLLCSFVLPILVLLWMLWQQPSIMHSIYASVPALLNSASLAILAALLMVVVSSALVLLDYQLEYAIDDARIRRRSPKSFLYATALQLSSMGYALPGTVLAIALYSCVLLLSQFINTVFASDWQLSELLNQSIIGLLLIYLLRFLAISNNTLAATLFRLSPNVWQSSQLFPVSQATLLRLVYWRYLRLPALSALVFVFVEVIKEMPGTLMLRPFGWDTLAVQIFGLTQEAEWTRAALPSLLLIMLSMSAVFFLLKNDH